MTPALREEVSRSICDALLLDAGYSLPPARAAAVRGYRRIPLKELGRMCFEAETGRELLWSDYDAFNAVTKTAAFSEGLYAFLKRATAEEFARLGDSATGWLKYREVENFLHTSYTLRFSEFATLSQEHEGGAFPITPITQDSTTRTAASYGKTFILPRQSFIGSDTGRFNELPIQMALAARMSLDELVIETLAENSGYGPTMTEDSEYLFSESHATPNLMKGATSALSKSSLTAGMKMLRNIEDLTGKRLKLRPAYLVVPAALEGVALSVRSELGLGATTIAGEGRRTESPVAVVHDGPLVIIVLPGLDDVSETGWYLSTTREASAIEMLSYGYPAPTPVIEPIKPEHHLALGWRLYVDTGIAVTDWRSILKSDGQ